MKELETIGTGYGDLINEKLYNMKRYGEQNNSLSSSIFICREKTWYSLFEVMRLLSYVRILAIIWSNAYFPSIELVGINFSNILIKLYRWTLT